MNLIKYSRIINSKFMNKNGQKAGKRNATGVDQTQERN